MPTALSRATAQDRPAILALIAQARGDDLSSAQRTCQGFVQGHLDDDVISRFQAESGVFVAYQGQKLAGVAMTSWATGAVDGLPALCVTAVHEAMPQLPTAQLFLYGPVAVDRHCQGQGILTQLLLQVCTELQSSFYLGIAFVELSNQKSLDIHRHYPMTETAHITFNERHYAVFTFAPEQVLKHYAAQRPRAL